MHTTRTDLLDPVCYLVLSCLHRSSYTPIHKVEEFVKWEVPGLTGVELGRFMEGMEAAGFVESRAYFDGSARYKRTRRGQDAGVRTFRFYESRSASMLY